jgi:competence protein ComEA
MVGAWWGTRSAPAVPTPPVEVVGGEVVQPAIVPVHVSGWVVSPGVVWVPAGSLVSEAISAAGGALAGADLDAINLAQEVYEGDQLVVTRAGNDAGGAQTAGDGLIDINRADATELQALPGVGPVLAANIISHRDDVGRFDSVEDLLDVPGIGETRLASIRDLIRPP